MMPPASPLSHHVDLYRYWDSKREGRCMPARRDIDPAQIRLLLEHLMLVERVNGRFRYRLVGSKVVQDLDREITGSFVGSHVAPAEYAEAISSIYHHVCTSRMPVFTTGEYRSPSRLLHRVSRLLLPLGNDGSTVNMILLSRVSQFAKRLREANWLECAAGAIGQTCEVKSEADVRALSLAWDRASTSTPSTEL